MCCISWATNAGEFEFHDTGDSTLNWETNKHNASHRTLPTVLDLLAMAERSRSPRREKYLWVKVKGGVTPIKVNITGLHDVDDLRKAVKKEVKNKLGGVDSDDLQIFQSEEAKDGGSEAVRPGVSLADLNGGDNDENPLYVFYPDMNPDSTASQARRE